MNRFVYAESSPLDFWDPTGRNACRAGLISCKLTYKSTWVNMAGIVLRARGYYGAKCLVTLRCDGSEMQAKVLALRFRSTGNVADSSIADSVQWEVRVNSDRRPIQPKMASTRRADIVTSVGWFEQGNGKLLVSEAKLWSPTARAATLQQLQGYINDLNANIRDHRFTAGSIVADRDPYFRDNRFLAAYRCRISGRERECVTWGDPNAKGLIWYAPTDVVRRNRSNTDLRDVYSAIELLRPRAVQDMTEQKENSKRYDREKACGCTPTL